MINSIKRRELQVHHVYNVFILEMSCVQCRWKSETRKSNRYRACREKIVSWKFVEKPLVKYNLIKLKKKNIHTCECVQYYIISEMLVTIRI